MIWSYQVPATELDWMYVLGEVKELLAEIREGNIKGMIEELCDVYTCASIAVTTSTGIPIPIFWTLTHNKYLERVTFFKWYFKCFGLEYKLKYLKNGANYNKSWKRVRALRLAVNDQFT